MFPYHALCLGLSLAIVTSGTVPALGQCKGEEVTEEGYLVREVKVEALFGRVPPELAQLLARHRGEVYRPFDTDTDTLTINANTAQSKVVYMREVRDFLAKGSDDSRFGVSRFTEVSVKAYTACATKVSQLECETSFRDDPRKPVTKCVDVTVKTRAVYVNTGDMASNLLALARRNGLLFYQQIPSPLLAFNPSFQMDHDREYGTALAGSIKTNLLELPAILHGRARPGSGPRLVLKLDGSRALNESFHNTSATLELLDAKPRGSIDSLGLAGSFTNNREPQGTGVLLTNAGHLNGILAFKFSGGNDLKLDLRSGYRWANNRRFSNDGLAERIKEDAFAARAVADSHLAGGFVRGALWLDSAAIDKAAGSYRRLASLAGYTREFALPQRKCRVQDGRCKFAAKNPPAIGVEILAGGGRAWGSAPEYTRFYGGNTAGNFLYDNRDAPVFTMGMGGPLLRSFGRNQAGVFTDGARPRGGTSYWHWNLTVTLPIPALSRALIPALALTDRPVKSCDDCSSVKDFIKNNVNEGKNLYVDATAYGRLSRQQKDDLGLDPDDARTPAERNQIEDRLRRADEAFTQEQAAVRPEAEQLWNELTPMVRRITDHANLYAVKPMVMFDMMRINLAGARSEPARHAVGGGLQFIVLLARFEIGYMRTLRALPGDQRGNVILRLVFERFY
jgi:hypothetical protein